MEVLAMKIICSSIIGILTNIIGHFICKWLDANDNCDNYPNKKAGVGPPAFFDWLYTFISLSNYIILINQKKARIKTLAF